MRKDIVENERKAMLTTNCPYIVKYKDCFLVDFNFAIVMEFCPV